MINISSPVPAGSGAIIAHRSLEEGLDNYKVYPYNPHWALVPPVLRLFGDRNADIIHVPVDYAVFARTGNTPLVSTFHGFVLDEYIRKYSSFLQNIHYRTDLKWFISRALETSSVITCVSNYLADLVRQNLGYRGDIRVIHNGVDVSKFYPHKNRRYSNEFRVLYCGGSRKKKGAHLVPQIMNRTYDHIKFYCVPDLPEALNTVNQYRVQSMGRVAYKDMPALYNQMDLLLLPSVREGFGLVAAEAMACGLPVIASDCSALPELIKTEGGYLCPVDDVDTFAKKINLLADSRQSRTEMGEYNRHRIVSQFTQERMVRDYKELFESLIP